MSRSISLAHICVGMLRVISRSSVDTVPVVSWSARGTVTLRISSWYPVMKETDLGRGKYYNVVGVYGLNALCSLGNHCGPSLLLGTDNGHLQSRSHDFLMPLIDTIRDQGKQ